MKATEIPFVAHVGIEAQSDGALQLVLTEKVSNHVGTMHASALFTLAETQSGVLLQQLFPEYGVDEVMPLLRGSNIKYHGPAVSMISAAASVAPEAKEKFLSRFERRGKAGITVTVMLRDTEGTVVMMGEFSWFVQKRS